MISLWERSVLCVSLENPMDEADKELASYGVEECRCDGYDSYDQPCDECGERVSLVDHTHFKGQLFHLICLLLAVLRQMNGQPKE